MTAQRGEKIMNIILRFILMSVFAVGMTQLSVGLANAGEHGGQEHGGQEHGGKGSMKAEAKGSGSAKGSMKESSEPSKEAIRDAMKTYVMAKAATTGGFFTVQDVDTGKARRLSLVKVHERVGKTGASYYSCADFKDADSGEMLDLDLDVMDHHGMLMVTDVRIHKLEGEPRYTYDDQDNRIPLKEGTQSHLGTKAKGAAEGVTKGSAKANVSEHGGQEHGGQEHGGKEHGGK